MRHKKSSKFLVLLTCGLFLPVASPISTKKYSDNKLEDAKDTMTQAPAEDRIEVLKVKKFFKMWPFVEEEEAPPSTPKPELYHGWQPGLLYTAALPDPNSYNRYLKESGDRSVDKIIIMTLKDKHHNDDSYCPCAESDEEDYADDCSCLHQGRRRRRRRRPRGKGRGRPRKESGRNEYEVGEKKCKYGTTLISLGSCKPSTYTSYFDEGEEFEGAGDDDAYEGEDRHNDEKKSSTNVQVIPIYIPAPQPYGVGASTLQTSPVQYGPPTPTQSSVIVHGQTPAPSPPPSHIHTTPCPFPHVPPTPPTLHANPMVLSYSLSSPPPSYSQGFSSPPQGPPPQTANAPSYPQGPPTYVQGPQSHGFSSQHQGPNQQPMMVGSYQPINMPMSSQDPSFVHNTHQYSALPPQLQQQSYQPMSRRYEPPFSPHMQVGASMQVDTIRERDSPYDIIYQPRHADDKEEDDQEDMSEEDVEVTPKPKHKKRRMKPSSKDYNRERYTKRQQLPKTLALSTSPLGGINSYSDREMSLRGLNSDEELFSDKVNDYTSASVSSTNSESAWTALSSIKNDAENG